MDRANVPSSHLAKQPKSCLDLQAGLLTTNPHTDKIQNLDVQVC